MDWVKRNLYFVLGSSAAVVLMGLAGWYLWSGWQHKNEVFEKLSAQYAELKRLYDLNPNPGNNKVNNIQAAKDQQAQLQAFLRSVERYFAAPPAIPPVRGTNRVSSEVFTSALRRTVDQLQRDAATASVNVPQDYSFSFEAQKTLMRFAPGSLDALATQLGEIKVLSEVLFAAKINSLDNIRRERVSNDDYKGPPSDYLNQKSVTNELAVLTPYELIFRCFSGELAAVLNGLHATPYGLLVKTVDIEPATASPGGLDIVSGGMGSEYLSRYGVTPGAALPIGESVDPVADRYAERYRTAPEGVPAYTPTPGYNPYTARYGVGGMRGGDEGGAQAAAARYGPDGGVGGGVAAGGIPYRPLAGAAQPGMGGYGLQPSPYPSPYASPYATQPNYAPMTGATPGRSALQTVLDEQQLRVTLLVHVVKLLPREGRR